MLNGKKMDGSVKRILNKEKMKQARALIKKHNITAKKGH